MYLTNELKKLIAEDQKKLKNAKSKEDLNALFTGRIMIVQDNSDWQNERCVFVEMVGGEKRDTWKMKIKTSSGMILELPANKVMITVQTLIVTEKEAVVIKNDLTQKGGKFF